MRSPTTGEGCQGGDASAAGDPRNAVATMGTGGEALGFLLIHESPLTDALFLLVSKSDEVTTT